MIVTSLYRISHNKMSFISFINNERGNRIYLFLTIGISVVLWTAFKLCYPYPNMVLDSYHYVQAAVSNADVNAWPIGYSKFIRLAGSVSHSPIFLVTLQYLLMQMALLFFFFSIRFFLNPTAWSSNFLFGFLFLNPIFIYTCNIILSDALFIALSIIWFTHLLWVIYTPRAYMIFTHALILLLTFTVRYNALYYPLAASLAFMLCRHSIWFKAGGILLQCLLLGIFILFTSYKMHSITGERQFTAFGGWKLANDALYMYEHVHDSRDQNIPEKFAS